MLIKALLAATILSAAPAAAGLDAAAETPEAVPQQTAADALPEPSGDRTTHTTTGPTKRGQSTTYGSRCVRELHLHREHHCIQSAVLHSASLALDKAQVVNEPEVEFRPNSFG